MYIYMLQLLATSILAGERQRPLRREEYDRLVEQGCFEDERVELLHGMLITMSPQGPRHATVIENLTMLLVPAVLGRARVRVQSPLAASDDSEPEPDLSMVAPGPRPHGHPHTALLVVEVAETSLAKDRQIKAGIYVACGVPEYWVVNLPERTASRSRPASRTAPTAGTAARVAATPSRCRRSPTSRCPWTRSSARQRPDLD